MDVDLSSRRDAASSFRLSENQARSFRAILANEFRAAISCQMDRRSRTRIQRGVKRPLTPPGSGAGSVASCSTSASTSERCDGESLIKALHSRKPCTVSLEGYPSEALTSEADVRFFIRAFSQPVHATTSEAGKCFVKKYAKEDQREQVMSIVAHHGTFAEVAFTASYPFCLEYKLTLCR